LPPSFIAERFSNPDHSGSGYAGGIVTSAADGWRTVADWLRTQSL